MVSPWDGPKKAWAARRHFWRSAISGTSSAKLFRASDVHFAAVSAGPGGLQGVVVEAEGHLEATEGAPQQPLLPATRLELGKSQRGPLRLHMAPAVDLHEALCPCAVTTRARPPLQLPTASLLLDELLHWASALWLPGTAIGDARG